jgi:hypothetical protein
MHPLQQPLRFWVSWFADNHLGTQHAAERVRLSGQYRAAAAVPADRPFAVPHQRARHRPQPLQQPPPAREQILRAP